MVRRHRRLAVLGALCAVAASLLPSIEAAAQTSYTIRMGQNFPRKSGVPGFASRFYPESIRVHEGDAIHFRGGPMLLPAGSGPTEWREENAARLDDPWALYHSDPDEGPDAVKYNTALFFSNVACGTDAASPCAYDGTGDEIFAGDTSNFYVTVEANPGTTLYAIDLFGDDTNFRIDVVEDSAAASTQTELDQRADRLRDQDFEDAAALHAKYSAKRTKHTDSKGRVVWDAWAGVDTEHVGLIAFYPQSLNVKKGQIVQWHFNLQVEFHTVTMPFDKGRALANGSFVPTCDPDGDAGTAPDNPPETEEPPFCNDPAQTEIDVADREAHQRGNGVFEGNKDFETSGLRADERLSDGLFSEAPYEVRFAETGRWRYLCTFHGPFMSGTVNVTR